MTADELFSIGLIPLLLIFFVITFLWIRSRRPPDLPPGPVSLPVLGNLLYLLAGDLRKVSESLRKKYGSLFSLSLGPHLVIFVNGIDTLKDVFVKKEAYFSDRPDVYFFTHIKARQGTGLAAANPWKEQRAFTFNLLRGFGFGKTSMESTIVNEAKRFVSVVANGRGIHVYINGLINKAVANVICSIIFGKRFEYDDEKFHNFMFAITETVINKYIPKVNLFPFLRFVPGDVFRVQQCKDQNKMVLEGIQKYIDEHNSTLNEDDVSDFNDAYLLEIKHHKHEKNTLFTGN